MAGSPFALRVYARTIGLQLCRRHRHLAEMTGGYPLGMKEVVNRKLATPKGVNGPVSPPKVNGP
ncbi:MAG: hypothetical protein ABSF48_20805 [Thermodesulfobacteriota bacterium]|jgi:hypothetical protein